MRVRGLGDAESPVSSQADSDWFHRDVLPIITTALNAGAGVVKTLATSSNPYGTPAGVSPLAFNSMTPLQQQQYLATMQPDPFASQLKSMMPMLLISGVGLVAFLMLTKKS